MCQCSSRIAGTLGCNAPNYLMFFKDRWNLGVQCSKLPYQRSLCTCYLHVSSSCPPLVYNKWSCQCSSRIAGILACNAPNYPTSGHYAPVIFTSLLLVDPLCITSGHVNVLQEKLEFWGSMLHTNLPVSVMHQLEFWGAMLQITLPAPIMLLLSSHYVFLSTPCV